jgi:hypothetical protein
MTSVAIATKSNVYGKPAAIPANRPPFRQIGHHSGGPEKSGWFRSGIMAGLLRNGWPVSSGISGRFGPEYADGVTHWPFVGQAHPRLFWEADDACRICEQSHERKRAVGV